MEKKKEKTSARSAPAQEESFVEKKNIVRTNCLVYLEKRMPEEEILFRMMQMAELLKGYGNTLNVWLHPDKPWMGVDCGDSSPQVSAELAGKLAEIWERPVLMYDECGEDGLTLAYSDENSPAGTLSRSGEGGLPMPLHRFFPCSRQAEEIWNSRRYALPLDRLFALSEAMKEPVPLSLLGKRRGREKMREYNHLSLCM